MPLPHDNDVPVDMQAELDKFDHAAETLIASFLGPIDSQPAPPRIYHYTNDMGLRGILESGNLWVTDIFNLNDPSELSHGFSHAVKTLNDMAAGGPPETKLFGEQFRIFATEGGIRASAHYFVCSFSADGDDLGQWRAYADNGRGYALGFDGPVLENGFTRLANEPIPNNSTFPVTYNDTRLTALHREIIEAAFPLISLPRGKGLSTEAIKAYMRELSILVSMHALRAALFFKHEAYRNEQEFRFLQVHRADIPPPEVKFRNRPHSLVRYRKFDWRRAAPRSLTRVVIGPAADQERATQFVRDCLATFHPHAVEITRSEIPYRAG